MHLGWNKTYSPAISIFFFFSNYKSNVNAGIRNGGQQDKQGQMGWGLLNLCVKVIVIFGRSSNQLRDSISRNLQSNIIPDLDGFDLKTL